MVISLGVLSSAPPIKLPTAGGGGGGGGIRKSFIVASKLPTNSSSLLRTSFLSFPSSFSGYYLNPQFQYSRGFSVHAEIMKGLKEVIKTLEPDIRSQNLAMEQIEIFRYKQGSFSTENASTSFKTMQPGSDVIGEDIMQMFVKDRQTNGDIISKAFDMLWRRDDIKFSDSETSDVQEDIQRNVEVAEDEFISGFLKLTKTQEWVSGDNVAPVNKRLAAKDWQNSVEKRKKLNLLKYEALKRELLLLTTGIGVACSGYCLVVFSFEAAISYAAGVLFSCLYLQLLNHHTDKLSKEDVPKVFLQKKAKKIGIRSEDLKDTFEKTLNGSTMALSSPRLVIPAAIYGLWALSHSFLSNYFDFQLVPGMFGFFAYKAAALVQVYRDNKDLLMVLPDYEES